MTTIIWINLIGIFLIFLIIWWFWLYKDKSETRSVNHKLDIIVENGVYIPATITARAGKNIQLSFLRKDATPCSQWVTFPQLNKSFLLPLNQPFSIELSIKERGEYEFTCQMNMYRGKLIIK